MSEQAGKGKGAFAYVEAVLYDYPFLQARLKNYPVPHTDILVLGRVKDFTSPQEKFACREAETIRTIAAVNGALRAMQPGERKLIRLKYFERWPNYVVARKLHVSRATFYRLRENAVKKVGLALGAESLESQGFADMA
ncbi:MAG: DUF1492 domain-containing protein [Bacteroidota bacterium]